MGNQHIAALDRRPEDGASSRRRTIGSVPEQVLQRIRHLIEQGTLESGNKLPSERELATQFCVGRPAVREAIKALAMLGVLETRRGDGTYVAAAAQPFSGLAPNLVLDESNSSLIELLEVRKMFEPRAAALAASRATDRQLKEIERELLVQEADPDNCSVLEQYDYRFHAAIIRAAANRVLSEIVRVIDPYLRRSRKLTARTTPDVPKIVQQHRTILEAIRLGQPELAERAMTEHLLTVGMDVISERKR